MPRIQPINKKVLIKRLIEEKKGMIIIPETLKEKKGSGIILEIAKECEKVKKGDKIIFPLFQGSEIRVDNETLVIIDEEEILAIIKEKEEKEVKNVGKN